MSSTAANPSSSVSRSLPIGRWAFLATLLVAEFLLLRQTYRDPIRDLAAAGGWWGDLLWTALAFPKYTVPVALAVWFLWGDRLRAKLENEETWQRPQPFWLPLATHLMAYLGFAQLTDFLAEGGIRYGPAPGAWVVAWVAAGFVTLATLIAIAVPPNTWAGYLKRSWPLLLGLVAIGVVVWGTGWLSMNLFLPLAQFTFGVVLFVLGLFMPDVFCRPDEWIIGTQRFSVEMSLRCSGYEGIGLILTFVGVYLWVFRRELRFPHALLLLPLAALTAWCSNIVRLVSLIALGTWVSESAASEGFHSQAGWLAFNGVALGVVAVAQRSRLFAAPADTGVEAGIDRNNPTSVYLAPFVALMAGVMVTTAFSASGFDALYPLRVLLVVAVAACFWRTYVRWQWGWSWSAAGVGVLVFVMWMALEPFAARGNGADGQALANGLAGLPAGLATAWIVCRVLGSVVTVPFAEELAFRGYLTRRLLAADFEQIPLDRFSWLAFVLSSVCFGALHGRWLAGTLAGMAYALVVYRRGRVSDAVLAHATTNALIAAYVLTTGSWSLWC